MTLNAALPPHPATTLVKQRRNRSWRKLPAPPASTASSNWRWIDGRALYEGELRSGAMEYEFEIDAVTGAIVDWEADRD